MKDIERVVFRRDATALRSIDCDVHPAVNSISDLMPYLAPEWQEFVQTRGIDDLELSCFSPNSPLMGRADWRDAKGKAGTSLEKLATHVFDGLEMDLAICNCLYGVQGVMSEDLAAALCTGLNGWLAAEWLDRDERLRGSIVVPVQNPELAAKEIERWADDPRFVQVLILGLGEMMLGRRYYWPIYEMAERHELPIGLHLGSAYRFATTSLGWPTTFAEDYVDQAQGVELQLLSLIAEGVFSKFPGLKVVLLETGATWIPSFLWRADKSWRALRSEVPWLKVPPSEIIRKRVRVTMQPFDGPPDPQSVGRILEHIGSDEMLLLASDYPHWQFDGDNVVPPPLREAATDRQILDRVMFENALETYPRLRKEVS